ncbi:MFS transporter [Proteiniborus sp. MB09-C3]|uniref:MFS transporter n=1 Tax=Proteiniborus sp. MB09-C3 TaxID=3050072 RepID=UPI0025547643|nr:MFS transporter [Proteiniborus sp. MB09-C3]WIV11037.1 MFS transporter [Proteiniborus sp. MB09-C3]
MTVSRTSLDKMMKNRSFIIFLIAQGITDIAEAFNFIAITSLIIQITGSGKYASFAVLCTPISSFILSPFAGGIGDRYNVKYLVIIISLMRGITTVLFVLSYKTITIYVFMLILASFEVLYNPSRKTLILGLLGYEHIMIGNSVLLGISGFVFIIGPVAAGLIIDIFELRVIFFTTSILYFLSTILLFFIKSQPYKNNKKIDVRSNIYKDIRNGYEYFKSQTAIKELIYISTLMSLLVASMNTAFYPFAFDFLKITSKEWGIIMSVFYGTNMFAMIISIYFNKAIRKMDLLFSYFAIAIVSVVWLSYSLSNKLITVIVLQFIEGLFISLATIVLSTKLQVITRRDYTSRIIAINDIINNVGKLTSIVITYFILSFKPPQSIFLLNFAIIFSYGIYKLLFSN